MRCGSIGKLMSTQQKALTMAADQGEGFDPYRKPARCDWFLATMEQIVPRQEMCGVIWSDCPKAGDRRPPTGLERMLRMSFVQPSVFAMAGRLCGFTKVRQRGLSKSAKGRSVTLALVNVCLACGLLCAHQWPRASRQVQRWPPNQRHQHQGFPRQTNRERRRPLRCPCPIDGQWPVLVPRRARSAPACPAPPRSCQAGGKRPPRCRRCGSCWRTASRASAPCRRQAWAPRFRG